MAGRFDLGAVGEFGLVAAVRRWAGPRDREWAVAIGDDAAVLRSRPGRDLAVTADALVEGVHFRWSTSDPRSLGHKALAVNLSDLGAMGAEPLGFLLCLGLPRDSEGARVEGLLRGLLAEARAARCPLVGGDTVASPVWLLSVTALGRVPRGCALLRSGARPGDRVLVSGGLGGSALGLRLLEAGGPTGPAERALVRRHLRPRPPLGLGPKLARRGDVSAAIDISDGLLGDLGHVARESGVGAELDLERLPLARGLRSAAARLGADPLALALHGGEDYELLLCVRPGAPSAPALARALGVRLSEIGRIRPGRGVTTRLRGEAVEIPGHGWDHFKPASGRAEE